MKRLGIFVFFDRKGIVSQYIEYLLAELKSVITYQIIVVNGLLQPSSKEVLEDGRQIGDPGKQRL